MKRRFLLAARLVLAALAASGCAGQATPSSSSPIASATGPSAAASPSCTPIGATVATPCSQQQYDQLQQRRADYAEAERVYRAFFEEDAKLLRSGELANQEVLSLVAGPMVEKYKQEKKSQHDVGLTSSGGEYKLVYVRPFDGSYEGSDVSFATCADGSSMTGYQNGKVIGKAATVQGHAFLKRVDGAFRVWWTDGKYVSSC